MTHTQPVGEMLRGWRKRRQLSQLDLALRADVSTRHLSFLETGRARPTSTMIETLSEQLDVPLRERNALLLAAGFAPRHPEHALSDAPMAAIADAIAKILAAHTPYPAAVVDRHWEVVDANPSIGLFLTGAAPWLVEPPINVLRLSLHPDGMASRILNLAEWRAHLLERLRHQVATTADPVLVELLEELLTYPGGEETHTQQGNLVVPLCYASAAGELNLFSTTTVFGTPLDVTVAELAIESFFPADPETAARLK